MAAHEHDAAPPGAGPEVQQAAGGVVFRRRGGGFEFLLGDQQDWNTGARNVRLPKGRVDPGETLEQTALREVREETGRLVELRERLGESRYRFEVRGEGRVVDKRVAYFLLADLGPADTPPDGELAPFWCAAAEAVERLTFDNEREAARRALQRLESGAAAG